MLNRQVSRCLSGATCFGRSAVLFPLSFIRLAFNLKILKIILGLLELENRVVQTVYIRAEIIEEQFELVNRINYMYLLGYCIVVYFKLSW